jgi:hypothetical protein
LPIKNKTQYIQDLVIADIEKRRELGISRYGTALQAGNGRDALRDAYEEAIDLSMYLKQAIVERDAMILLASSACDHAWTDWLTIEGSETFSEQRRCMKCLVVEIHQSGPLSTPNVDGKSYEL